jgi:hypothetical protein
VYDIFLKERRIELRLQSADRTDFDTLRALRKIIFEEANNAIFINVSSGSKIQSIASMMVCMIFKDRVDIMFLSFFKSLFEGPAQLL